MGLSDLKNRFGNIGQMMKLTAWECRKVLSTRVTAVFFVVCFAASSLLFTAKVYLVDVGDRFLPAAYRALTEDVRGENLEEVYAALSGTLHVMQWEYREPETMYTSSLREEILLYMQVLEEIRQAAGYQEYVENILTENKRQSSVSLFGNDERRIRNAEKTAQDFADMRSVEVTFEASRGVNLFMETDWQDLLSVIVAMILVSGLLSAESESGRMKVIACTFLGRRHTAYAKYIAGMAILTIYEAAAYIYRFVLAAVSYGTGSMNAPFQSVYGAFGCTLRITTGEALFLFVLLKLLVVFFTYSVLFLITICVRYAKLVYCVGLGVAGLSSLFYDLIDARSYLSILKWVNPAAAFHTDKLLMNYWNLSVVVYPVGHRALMTGVCLFVIVITLFLIGYFYPKMRYAGRQAVPERFYAKLERIFAGVSGRDSLGGYEFRKWSFYQRGLLICLAALAVGLFVYEPAGERLYTVKEIYYKDYVKRLEGRYNEEKLFFLYEEKEGLDEADRKLSNPEGRYTDAALEYYRRESEKREGLSAVIEYGKYLKEKEGSFFVYEQGYDLLLGEGDGGVRLFWYRMFALAVSVILFAFIWGIESETGMRSLLGICAAGRKKLSGKKRIQVLLAGLIVFCIVYIPWIYSVLSVFGTTGILAPAYSMMRFSGLPSWMPLIGVLFLFYALHLVCLWAAGFFMQYVYDKLGAMLPSALTVFAVFVIPILIAGT